MHNRRVGVHTLCVSDSDALMTPLQRYVLDRLAALDLSYRAAADRSGGMVSFGTINQLATGRHRGKLTERAQRGLALALDVPLGKVQEKYEASRDLLMPVTYRLPDRAQNLTPKQFKAVLAVIDGYLEGIAKVSSETPQNVVGIRRPSQRPRPAAATPPPSGSKRR